MTHVFSSYSLIIAHINVSVTGDIRVDLMLASFTGGKVVITGVNLTNTMRDDLTKAFKLTFSCFSEKTDPHIYSL